jgi:hypothetical protein
MLQREESIKATESVGRELVRGKMRICGGCLNKVTASKCWKPAQNWLILSADAI